MSFLYKIMFTKNRTYALWIKYKSYNYPVAIIIYHIHGITFLQALSMTVI